MTGGNQLTDSIGQLQRQIDQQKIASQEQIMQSERNLAEHFKTLTQQQQVRGASVSSH